LLASLQEQKLAAAAAKNFKEAGALAKQIKALEDAHASGTSDASRGAAAAADEAEAGACAAEAEAEVLEAEAAVAVAVADDAAAAAAQLEARAEADALAGLAGPGGQGQPTPPGSPTPLASSALGEGDAAAAGVSAALVSKLARSAGPQAFLVGAGLGGYACGSAALGADYLADFVDPEVGIYHIRLRLR
jgi:hypothetical protein